MLGDSVRRRSPIRARTKPAPKRPHDRGRWRRWAPALLGALIVPFLIGYALAVFVFFPAPEVHGQGIVVPSLTGLTLAQAQTALSEAGLGPPQVTELPHPSRPAGVVTAQSPLPGQQLLPGAPVRVAVSGGPPRAVVPDVEGFSAERAEALLRRLGFEVTIVEEESFEDAGRVLRVTPGPASEHLLPALITMVVSTGPAEPLEPLPRPDTSSRQ